MDKTKLKKMLPTYIFNIFELVFIIWIGMLLNISIYKIACILLLFSYTRSVLKEQKHYKSPYKCFIWTATIFFTLFLVAIMDTYMCLLLTFFAAYIVSGKADIFLWKSNNEDSKYKYVEDYVRKNKGSKKLIIFENILKEIDEVNYQVYKLKFYHKDISQNCIAKELRLGSTARVSERLDMILMTLQTYELSPKEVITKE